MTSHLSMVPLLLEQTLRVGDVVVDATAGNGHDSLMIARLVFPDDEQLHCSSKQSDTALSPREFSAPKNGGRLVCVDIQRKALVATEARLAEAFPQSLLDTRVSFVEANHRDWGFLDALAPDGVRAFVYNLGYLPGGDKSFFTQADDTVRVILNKSNRI